jgi:hypothetical protein
MFRVKSRRGHFSLCVQSGAALNAYTGAAEITPTFQRGITNKSYEVSPKTVYFPNVDIKKFFYVRF